MCDYILHVYAVKFCQKPENTRCWDFYGLVFMSAEKIWRGAGGGVRQVSEDLNSSSRNSDTGDEDSMYCM